MLELFKFQDDIIYEPPVPALTPPTNNADLENHTPLHTIAYTTPAPLPPRPSTTLRTIIRPDSEIYHGKAIAEGNFPTSKLQFFRLLFLKKLTPTDRYQYNQYYYLAQDK